MTADDQAGQPAVAPPPSGQSRPSRARQRARTQTSHWWRKLAGWLVIGAAIASILTLLFGENTVGRILALVDARQSDNDPVDNGRGAGALAVVFGYRSNSPKPTFTREAEDLVLRSIQSEDAYFLINVSGHPSVVARGSLSVQCREEESCESRRGSRVEALSAEMLGHPNSTPEADLLAAIALAFDNIRGYAGRKSILTIDSGLSTTGALDLSDFAILDENQEDVARAVVAQGYLEDLTGVDILLTGVGQRSGAQTSLPHPDIAKLRSLWKLTLEQARASSVNVSTESLVDSQEVVGLPPVAPVSRPSLGAEVNICSATTSLTASQIGFPPSSAEFINHDAASRQLSAVASRLITSKALVRVTGTAAVSDRSEFALSLSRANAVRDILVTLGVPPERITAVGVGTHFSGFKDARDPATGQFNPAIASQMRRVILSFSCP